MEAGTFDKGVAEFVRQRIEKLEAAEEAVGHVAKLAITATDALELVNGVRGALNAPPLTELPAGVQGDTRQCVYARAFTVNGVKAHVTSGGAVLSNVPEEARHRIEAIGLGTADHEAGKATITSEKIGAFISLFDPGTHFEKFTETKEAD